MIFRGLFDFKGILSTLFSENYDTNQDLIEDDQPKNRKTISMFF